MIESHNYCHLIIYDHTYLDQKNKKLYDHTFVYKKIKFTLHLIEYYKLNHILVIGIYYDELDFIISVVDMRLLEMKLRGNFRKKEKKTIMYLGFDDGPKH